MDQKLDAHDKGTIMGIIAARHERRDTPTFADAVPSGSDGRFDKMQDDLERYGYKIVKQPRA